MRAITHVVIGSMLVLGISACSDETNSTPTAVTSETTDPSGVTGSSTPTDLTAATTAPAETTTTTPPPDVSTAQAVLDAFAAAGLPIGDSVVYTAETDPNEMLGRPGSYHGKATWIDTRPGCAASAKATEEGWECGGDIEMFDSATALANRYEYLTAFANDAVIGGYYMWRTDTAVIRVGFALTPDQAMSYDSVIRTLFSDVQQYEG